MGPRLRGDDFESVVTAFDSIRRFRDTFTSSHAESVALIRAETPAAPAQSIARLCTRVRAEIFWNNFASTSHV
jgi:hypothetical protein